MANFMIQEILVHIRVIKTRFMTHKKTRIKLYNTLSLPVLLYYSETWTNKARDARRITAAEMNNMRGTAGYT